MTDDSKTVPVKEDKKTAFMARPYKNKKTVEDEEKELQELEAAQTKEAETAEEEQQEAEALENNPEERTFKKRYSDLRRHAQKNEKELNDRISKLEQKLETAKAESPSLPAKEEDVAKWMEEYPDIAAIIETMILKNRNDTETNVSKRFEEIEKREYETAVERAEAKIMRVHPDFEDLRENDSFHDWVDAQPKWIKDAVYENDTDADGVIRVLDFFKQEKGLTKPKPKGEKEKKADESAAASSVKGSSAKPDDGASAKGVWKESDVDTMSEKEYEKNLPSIMESIQKGTFEYDMTGGAR